MEILHIAKTPPAAPEITHIDVRLTRDEAFLIGAFVARTNSPLGDALLPPHKSAPGARGGGAIADDIYNKMRVALNLPVDGFNDHYTYLALVDGPGYVRQDGRATPDYDVQGKQAETIAAQTKKIESLKAGNDALKTDNARLTVANDRQYTQIQVHKNTIANLQEKNDEQRKIIERLQRALRNIKGACADEGI